MAKLNGRLQPGRRAPAIKERDHSGKPFDLAVQTRLTMIQFHRYVGCPVCHLHVHDYLDRAPEWKSRGVDIVVFYYSTPDEVIGVGGFSADGLPITFICDPEKKVYRAFGVESSLWGTLSLSAWRDGALALIKGHSFRKAFPRKGLGGLPADFLIDAKGVIRKVRYGKAINDSLPVDGLLAWVDEIQRDAV
jgi:peroxiredoxin